VIGPASTVKAALDLLGEEAIDCAVLDVRLQDGASVPVAEALAALGIRFVIATGSDAIPEGYNGAPVLHKVFLPEEVIEAIADILTP
jgi:DNA-binding NarL/FixJ family response regulator